LGVREKETEFRVGVVRLQKDKTHSPTEKKESGFSNSFITTRKGEEQRNRGKWNLEMAIDRRGASIGDRTGKKRGKSEERKVSPPNETMEKKKGF